MYLINFTISTLDNILSIDNFFFCRNDCLSGEREVELLDTKFSSFPYELISEGKTAMCSANLFY